MANGLTGNNEAGKAGKDFRQAVVPAESRTMKSIAAFLGGMLLFAFSSAANVATVDAHNGPVPPSIEEQEILKDYPDATSLRMKQGHRDVTGLHRVFESGAGFLLDKNIVKDLRPADLAIADLDGRRVIDVLIVNPAAVFATPEIKELVRAYSETLGAEGQWNLASAAVDNKVLDMVSLDKLSSADLIKTIVTRVPLPLEQKPVEGTNAQVPAQGVERFRTVKSNLLLDALRTQQNSPSLQALVDRLTPAQVKVAAQAVDEYGGTVAHYWAQDRNVKALVSWKNELDWSAPDVTKVTPLGILAKSPAAFSSVFGGSNDSQLAAAVTHPDNRNAVENLVSSHQILAQSDDIVRAVVTPELLLGPSISGEGSVVSQLKPECLVAYFSPRVMGHWTPEQRQSVWEVVNPQFKHLPEVRGAYYKTMTVSQAPQTPGSLANALK